MERITERVPTTQPIASTIGSAPMLATSHSPIALPASMQPSGAIGRLRLRLWHRLLTPGWINPTPAARLRGWARMLDWHDAEGDRSRWLVKRAGLVKRAIWTPVRAWKEAGDQVRRFGADIEAIAGVSPRAMRWQLLWLDVRHGINAHSYRAYQLYRPERWRRASMYVQEREYYRVVRWYNRRHPDSDLGIMLDKQRFAEWCDAHGFPTVRALAEFDHGQLVSWMLPGEPTATSDALPAIDLFQKPADGTGGHGAERWSYAGEDQGARRWRARDGRILSGAALLAELAELSRTLPTKHGRTSRRMLLQPCLRNHRDLLTLTPGALCTLRVVTYREPGGPARALLAAYKLARAGAAGDNTDLGGISAPMDLATGTLGPGVGPSGELRVTYERHPDTGVVIAGHVVPYWRDAVALAVRALDAAQRLPSLGWDIAVTEDGPVLLEANPASNPGIAQAPTGVPLSDTPLPGAIEAHMRQLLGLEVGRQDL